MIKTSKIIRLYVEHLLINADNKEDYKEDCYYLYDILLNKYGWDKTQEFLEMVEQEYNIALEY